jgi:hypothetical protein
MRLLDQKMWQKRNSLPLALNDVMKLRTGMSAFLLVLRYCRFKLLSEFVNLV